MRREIVKSNEIKEEVYGLEKQENYKRKYEEQLEQDLEKKSEITNPSWSLEVVYSSFEEKCLEMSVYIGRLTRHKLKFSDIFLLNLLLFDILLLLPGSNNEYFCSIGEFN